MEKTMTRNSLLALIGVSLLGCLLDGGEEPGGATGGACEVSGGIIKSTCYEGWDDCDGSSDTRHAGKRCQDVGYARGCCDRYGQTSAQAKYWRPTGGSCDANDVVCGQQAPAQDKCRRCLDACRGDPLCCTGSGCYCDSEC
jgi:hypothetical protein